MGEEDTAQHTPGPWDWVEDGFRGGYSGLVGLGGHEVLFPNTCNDGDTGAAWFEDFPSPEDAHLIAAAPELLAACQSATRALQGVARRNERHVTRSWARDIVEELDVAIAKAEGAVGGDT